MGGQGLPPNPSVTTRVAEAKGGCRRRLGAELEVVNGRPKIDTWRPNGYYQKGGDQGEGMPRIVNTGQ